MKYILWITLDKDIQIKIGSLGKINFKKGVYFYVGSAKKNFQARIERHLVKKKKIFWHIDYLLSLNDAKIKQVWITDKDKECQIATFLYKKGYGFINRFGSSDCNCHSHLFFISKVIGSVQDLLNKRGFTPLEIHFKI
ncbi:MAG: GIY-YIG nuclease family protein [Candidatus Edwardsbacteria bacterium]